MHSLFHFVLTFQMRQPRDQKVREFVKVTQQVGKRGRFLSGTLTPSLSASQSHIVSWRSAARVDVNSADTP